MLILSAQDITKHYSEDPVLDGASLEIRAGQHVSLIGPNGSGKTTLLRILAQDLDADAGDLYVAPRAKIGFLEQRLEADPRQTVWELASSALGDLKELAQRAERVAGELENASGDEQAVLSQQYDELHQELDRRGGYQFEFRIRRVLEGLGFDADSDRQPVWQLSGGQQNRLMLAKLLLQQPDLMLLDEPSNHLDMKSTQWLEEFLATSKQAFLLVSHDRYFLDRVTDRTLELVNGQIEAYPGAYSKYKQLKEDRLAVQRRTFEKQQEEIEKLKDFIRRHHYGQKHTQAEDRRKKLERIDPVPPPREISAPRMKFHEVTRTGDIVLRANGIAKAFESPLFENVTFQIQRGQRLGIIGPNGSGKTTLLKCLLGALAPDAGNVEIGVGVEIGFFDQHLECVNADATAAEAIRPTNDRDPSRRLDDGRRRDLLARFGITGDVALQRVASLSGGQRNRVALANLAAQQANVLVLDEPTNHLDLWSREALEKALCGFEGTVILVSHDRYFLNSVCDRVLSIDAGAVMLVEGNYDTYCHLLAQRAAAPQDATTDAQSPQTGEREAAKRTRKFPYRKVIELEAEIADCEAAIARLHRELADPAVLRDRERVVQRKNALELGNRRLSQLYEHWEEATELN